LGRGIVWYLGNETKQESDRTHGVHHRQKSVLNLITEEFLNEDKLDQEVREILNQHMEKIRKENIEYQTLFRMIKTKLARERNIVL
jgi:hypothetical protein